MPNRYERECGYGIERLEEGVRVKVIERFRSTQCDHDWWDHVYEGATRMGALMGIEVEDISFTGFCSQGDGASFVGRYRYAPDAVQKITAECGDTDETLIAIAEELTIAQVGFVLKTGFPFECNIRRTSSNYSHSGTMQTGWDDDDDDYAANFFTCQVMDQQVERLLRRFADWIYKQLEAEHNHLTSDDAVIEAIRSSDLRFSSSGDIL